MNSSHLNFFWVIFDTGVRAEYYKDLHRLLAQPVGSVIRYDYSRRHCTNDALIEVEKGSVGHTVLLGYAQFAGFSKGDDYKSFPGDSKRWYCPTRLGTLVHLFSSGDRVYFDIQLGDYPDPTNGQFEKLMQDLELKKQTPFDKLVAISSSWGATAGGSKEFPSGSDSNWERIARALGKDSQYKGDTFWRLTGPFRRANNALVPVRRITAGQNNRYAFRFYEREWAYFHIYSIEPLTKPTNSAASVPSILVSAPDSTLTFPETKIDLRQYLRKTLWFRALKQETVGSEEPEISFSTEGPTVKDYEAGPRFSVPVSVGPRIWKMMLGSIGAWLGAIYLMVGLQEAPTYADTFLFAGATLVIALSSVLLYEKLKFSGGGD